ncbi:hypothetical protein Sjap_014933 [Stephania japonica]|uniref:Uncharacterized protein n=1 Tax=Stephania japonica TaxID=461633 RepID=A0AAP0II67_9MAGN
MELRRRRAREQARELEELKDSDATTSSDRVWWSVVDGITHISSIQTLGNVMEPQKVRKNSRKTLGSLGQVQDTCHALIGQKLCSADMSKAHWLRKVLVTCWRDTWYVIGGNGRLA